MVKLKKGVGSMAFWSKKRIRDNILKTLEEQNISYTEEQGYITFELYASAFSYSVFPYIKIIEETQEMSVIINVRKVEESLGVKELLRINAFNVASKYFTAKVKDGVILLEYNCVTSYEDCPKVFTEIMESIFTVYESVDKL